jgi:hypothetical protein
MPDQNPIARRARTHTRDGAVMKCHRDDCDFVMSRSESFGRIKVSSWGQQI